MDDDSSLRVPLAINFVNNGTRKSSNIERTVADTEQTVADTLNSSDYDLPLQLSVPLLSKFVQNTPRNQAANAGKPRF